LRRPSSSSSSSPLRATVQTAKGRRNPHRPTATNSGSSNNSSSSSSNTAAIFIAIDIDIDIDIDKTPREPPPLSPPNEIRIDDHDVPPTTSRWQ